MTKLQVSLAAALTLAVMFLASPAARAAGTAQNNLTVSANVLGRCSILAATLDFGDYDSVAARDAAGDIIVNCNQGASYWIGLGDGSNVDATTTPPTRQMAQGTNRLAYELYRDAGHGTRWDNSDPGAGAHVTAPTTGNQLAIQVHGRIPANQVVATGAYTDTVIMTVNF